MKEILYSDNQFNVWQCVAVSTISKDIDTDYKGETIEKRIFFKAFQ